MNATIDGILYTKIGTNEACVGKEDGSQEAVWTTREGVVKIRSKVLIAGVSCIVTMIGKKAFRKCQRITNIIIPNTVNTLKQQCFEELYLTEPLVIPSSVTNVESYFLFKWNSKTLIFCGSKDPNKTSTDGTRWISSSFVDNVIVPLNYENDEFCSKKVSKVLPNECKVQYEENKRIYTCFRKRNSYLISLFFDGLVLAS